MSTNDGGPAVQVLLKCGRMALISPIDADRVAQMEWRITSRGYVQSRGANSKSVLLHRFVLDAVAGLEVHHKNDVKTDCRRENLEMLSPSEHQQRHKHLVISRNHRSRIYEQVGLCKSCGREFVKDPNHRGRQTCCSKLCATKQANKARRRPKHVEA